MHECMYVCMLYVCIDVCVYQQFPGEPGAVRAKRTYKPKKEFRHRRHTGHPASAIPKLNFDVLRRYVLWCFGGG